MATDKLCLVSKIGRSVGLDSKLDMSMDLFSGLTISGVLSSSLGRVISLVSQLVLEER